MQLQCNGSQATRGLILTADWGLQEQENLIRELTDVVQRQKGRVAALQAERLELHSQLAAYCPAEQDKLRGEVGTLRERVGEMAALKVGSPLTLEAFCGFRHQGTLAGWGRSRDVWLHGVLLVDWQ